MCSSRRVCRLSDGNHKFMAERGAGSFVNIDDTDPVGARALQKLKGQDYASAGLVDAGPEKFFVKQGPEGRWCKGCNTLWHSLDHGLRPVRRGDDPRVRDEPGTTSRPVHALRGETITTRKEPRCSIPAQ